MGIYFIKLFCIYSAYSQWWGYVAVHTCTFSGQLNTLLPRDLILTVLYFNISDGDTFDFNELLCWRFDGWLWCVEPWCVVRTGKKILVYWIICCDNCLSVFIEICFILMIMWTCLSKSIWNSCISYWFKF